MFLDIDAGCIFDILIQYNPAIRAAEIRYVPRSILVDRLIISVIRCRDGLLYDVLILAPVFVIGIQILVVELVSLSLLPIIRSLHNRHQLHILRICGKPVQL